MVIGRTPLTEELYGKYIIDEYDKNYAVNIRNRFKAGARHIVVANFRKDGVGEGALPETGQRYTQPETLELRLFEERKRYGTDKQ